MQLWPPSRKAAATDPQLGAFPGVCRFTGRTSRSAARREGVESLRVFGHLPDAGARGCAEAGVRKASRDETAGEFAPAVVSVYGDLAPVYAVIFRFRKGTMVE